MYSGISKGLEFESENCNLVGFLVQTLLTFHKYFICIHIDLARSDHQRKKKTTGIFFHHDISCNYILILALHDIWGQIYIHDIYNFWSHSMQQFLNMCVKKHGEIVLVCLLFRRRHPSAKPQPPLACIYRLLRMITLLLNI